MDKISLLLNANQKKDYFEYYAREVLITLIPKEFDNLLNRDKPDLQDHIRSIGVEVTRADLDNELYAFSPQDRLFDSKSDLDNAINELKSLGFSPEIEKTEIDQIDVPLSSLTCGLLVEASKNKIQKLNNTGDDTVFEYEYFQHFRLFIYTTDFENSGRFLHELMELVVEAQINFVRKYEIIYVYSEYFGLWVCDLVTMQVHEYPITDKQIKQCKLIALGKIY